MSLRRTLALVVVLGGFATGTTAEGAPAPPTQADVMAVPSHFTWSELGKPTGVAISTAPGQPTSQEWTFEVGGEPTASLWWYGQLIGAMEIERDVDSRGIGYLWASANDRTFVSIKYAVDGLGPVRVSSVDFAQSSATSSVGSRFDINFRNVLQNGSISSGPVKVRVWLETSGNPGTLTATLAPESSFEVSSASPFPLRLATGTQRAAGSGLAVPFRLSSVDAQSRDLFVQATAVDQAVTVKHPTELLEFENLGVERQFDVVVELDPKADGGQFEVFVIGGRPNEMVSTRFNVTRRESTSRGMITRIAAGIVLASGLALVLYDRIESDRRQSAAAQNR